jgi:(1->4)-alpha-D-glucan 1-alpha-D-glucosylmutase
VHLMAPGVPDLYQGDELWFRALVDPDNRRAVDWTAREELLNALQSELAPSAQADAARLAEWCAAPEDDRLKLYVTSRLLHLRRERATLFTRGDYQPVPVLGEHAAQVLAFRRTHGDESVMVVVPRLTCGLGAGTPLGAAWGETSLSLGASSIDSRWRCWLSGQTVGTRGGMLALSDALSVLPVAALVNGERE